MLVGCVLVIGVALVSPASPATAQTAPRDAASQADRSQAKNTARMSGRVVVADTGKPLPRATVIVSAPDVPQFGVTPAGGRRALTNDDGVWEIADLPPGKYVITVSKAAYVRTQYGQRYARERARVVELREAATLTRLDIQVPRAGVITGRIGDEAGDPIHPAVVSLQQVRYVDGVPTLHSVAEGIMSVLTGGLTDDRGEYRIHGLGPGTYYVSAATDPIGTGAPGQTSHLAATYYPGTSNVSEAQSVTVGAGQELNVSFNLTRARVAKISGMVVGSSGEPIAAALRLKSTPPIPLSGAEVLSDANGRFTLADVPPGDYRLEVEGVRSLPMKELTSMPLTVTGDDVTDLVITTRPGATASGRIVTDDASAPPTGVDVFAVPASREAFTTVWRSGRPPERGEFQIQGLLGTHLIRATVPGGWFLKSVTLDKRSIIDSGYDFKAAAAISDIEVVVTRRATGLRGTVTKDDATTGDYTVVAFSTDEQRWNPQTRYVQVARPGQNQDFTLDGLPPDEYFVIALDYLEPGEETDRTRLDRWKTRATRVTVSDDQRSVVALKVNR